VAIIVDTGGLVALGDRRDRYHAFFRRYFEVDAQFQTLVVPVTVLPEVDYLVSQRAGTRTAIILLERITSGEIRIEQLTAEDFPRIVQLMRQYADASIGFVDASVVAVAERLGVQSVLTLARRHFGPIRPTHCQALSILP
jgi:predicted nucleic acid-binding protein